MTNATQFPYNSREWAKWLESRLATVERSVGPTAHRVAKEVAAEIFWSNGGGSGGGGGDTYQVFTPIGAPIPFLTDSIPPGFIELNGAVISRAAPYDKLFAVYGTKYGAGDGASTFGLPNLKGRTIVGLDPADPTMDVTGETGGTKVHSHTLSEAGWADIRIADTAGTILAKTISVPSRAMNTTALLGAVAGPSTVNSTAGSTLDGATDDGSSMQPFMTARWIARYADVVVPPPAYPVAVAPTPNTLALRDANGRSQMTDPIAAQDIATKAYVDAQAGDALPPVGPDDEVMTVVGGVWESAPAPDAAEIHVGPTPPADTGDFWYDPTASGGGGGGGSVGEVRHDNTGTYDYMGTAPLGTADSATGWTVTRITMSSPPVTGVATGAWTGRAGLVYV